MIIDRYRDPAITDVVDTYIALYEELVSKQHDGAEDTEIVAALLLPSVVERYEQIATAQTRRPVNE